MTPEQKKAATDAKVEKIKALCNELKMVLQAEQVVTESGIIRNAIYYLDTENYNVQDTPVR